MLDRPRRTAQGRGAAPDRGPLLLGHLSRYAARNPGAAARIGWALALIMVALGGRRQARRAAEQAMATAERLTAPYDHRRAESLARALG